MFPGLMMGPRSSWTPLSLNPLAYWLAHEDYVDHTGGSVTLVHDLSSFGNDLGINITGPEYAEIWSDGSGSLTFAADPLVTDAGSLISAISGADVAHSAFAYMRTTLTGDQSILCWDAPGFAPQINCGLFSNVGEARPQYLRVPDSGTPAAVTASASISINTNYVLAWVFTGTYAYCYVDGAIVAEGGCDVSALSLTRFRAGTAPGGSNSFYGELKLAGVVPRAMSGAEVQILSSYCHATYP